MLVREVMTTDVVSVEADASVQQAVGQMLQEGVGSVIVTQEGNPAGIVTETDVLKAGYLSERPFTEIPVSKLAGGSVVTVPKGVTVRTAVEKMHDHDVKKLPVVESMEIVGIITMTDVVRRQEELIDEALQLEADRKGWSADQNGLDLDGV